MTGDEIKLKILDGALLVAERVGYQKVTRADIEAEIGIPQSNIQYYFREMWRLRYELVRHAIFRENLIVLAQALGALDNTALTASGALVDNALKLIRERQTAALRSRNAECPNQTPAGRLAAAKNFYLKR